jgi:hypothetical protein
MCWLSWNLGASIFWNPQGLSRPVIGLLYLLLTVSQCRNLNIDTVLLCRSEMNKRIPAGWKLWISLWYYWQTVTVGSKAPVITRISPLIFPEVRLCEHLSVYLQCPYLWLVGCDSPVGIATCYGLDGTGIEIRWGRDFPYLSRPALGPNQPGYRVFPGGKAARAWSRPSTPI